MGIDEKDIEQIKKDGFKVLKKIVKKGDKQTEKQIFEKLTSENQDSIRKNLIMALRLLDTESAMKFTLNLVNSYDKEYDKLSRSEKELFMSTVWSLFGYVRYDEVIDFLIQMLNRVDIPQTNKALLSTLTFLAEEKETLMIFTEKIVSRIDQVIFFKGLLLAAIVIAFTNLDKDIEDYPYNLYELILHQIQELHYDVPRAILLSLIYIGNKDACETVKQIARRYKNGLSRESKTDEMWVDVLLMALNNLCGGVLGVV